ncbi:hypothetical protein BC833DRAFT_573225 [Globomyces pollinis-pini]|nr:hypothetical protein BC833DRAFT_573225 [Globomyces pollinis-pini]
MNSEEPDFRRTNLMLKEQLDSQRKINLQSEEIVYLKAKLDQQYQLTINLSNQLETIQRENLQLKRDLQSSIKENTFTGRPPLTQINRESQDHHNNEQTLRPLKLQNLANYDIDLKNTAKYHGNNNSNHSVPARLPELQRPHSTQPVEIDNDASLLLMLKKPGHHSPGSYSPPKSLTLPSINELNKNVRDPIGTPRFHSHGIVIVALKLQVSKEHIL